MKLEELVESLKAFEMELEENKRETKKGITLQVEFSPNDKGEDILEIDGLLTKNVNRAIKRINNFKM